METLLLAVLMMAMLGAVIGGLARLALPGPDPMGLGQTIAIGIVGSMLAGLVVGLLSGGRAEVGMVGSVLGATFLVWVARRMRQRRATVEDRGPGY